MFDDRQAESGAPSARGSTVDAVEALEQARQLVREGCPSRCRARRSRPCPKDRRGVQRICADGHGAGIGRVLDGVIEQIGQDLVHGFAIAENLRGLGGSW